MARHHTRRVIRRPSSVHRPALGDTLSAPTSPTAPDHELSACNTSRSAKSIVSSEPDHTLASNLISTACTSRSLTAPPLPRPPHCDLVLLSGPVGGVGCDPAGGSGTA